MGQKFVKAGGFASRRKPGEGAQTATSCGREQTVYNLLWFITLTGAKSRGYNLNPVN